MLGSFFWPHFLFPTIPPYFWIFLDFLGHLFKSQNFETFGTLLCILIHPIFWQKVSKNFWILSNPPPFLLKIPKKLVLNFPIFCGEKFWSTSGWICRV